MQCDPTTPIRALLLAGNEQSQSEQPDDPVVFKKSCKKDEDFKFALQSLVSNAAIKVFDLSESVLGPRAYRTFAVPLMTNTTIQVLSFQKCLIEPEHAKHLFMALQENQTIIQIDISLNSIRDDGAAAVADFLKINKSVQNLDMTKCNVSPNGAAALAEAIKINSTVQVLFLGENPLGDEGCKSIADGLKQNLGIRELVLRVCKIGDEGAMHMALALLAKKAKPVLKLLWMSNNDIRDAAALILCRSIREHQLEVFSIKNNKIDSMETNMECMEFLEAGCTKGFYIGGSGNFKSMYCDPKSYLKYSPHGGSPKRTPRPKSPMNNNKINPPSPPPPRPDSIKDKLHH